MLSLKEIDNLENEGFFKEVKDVSNEVFNLKHNKIKNFFLKSLAGIPVMLIVGGCFLQLEWDTGIPISWELPKSALLFVALSTAMFSIIGGVAALCISNLILGEINMAGNLKYINKILNKQSNLIYEKKDIISINSKIKKFSDKSKFILNNYEFYNKNESYLKNFKVSLIIINTSPN